MTDTNPDIEAVAEAMWRAESVRAARRDRLIPWSEANTQIAESWRDAARAALSTIQYQPHARVPEDVAKLRAELEAITPHLPEYGFDTFALVPADLRDRLLAALSETLAARQLLREAREALAGLLSYAEQAEVMLLVGDEGCHWPCEIARDVRDRIDAALPQTAPGQGEKG